LLHIGNWKHRERTITVIESSGNQNNRQLIRGNLAVLYEIKIFKKLRIKKE